MEVVVVEVPFVDGQGPAPRVEVSAHRALVERGLGDGQVGPYLDGRLARVVSVLVTDLPNGDDPLTAEEGMPAHGAEP